MAQNKIINIAPVALTNTLTTNILNCNITSLSGPVGMTMTQPYLIITRIAVVNKTTSTATFSLWKGATGANAAGTEVVGQATPVAANSSFVLNCRMRMDAADFLVGGAGTATALTIQIEAEIGVS
ncbi:MAG TPA: hypothetical protein VIY48_21105 [Candidatus Paceibacterota bacterium]